ncbi:D-2-hydroxyacid dehydrogenase [Shumkonia mesophila]|uniref:D-2-hydroxyacid dehydrogenase n=1 Tax=Shumkonia mesophila TaxID=2838854 RepID=UPI00293503CA|nr:D-2-hydroxyacid dehydrogenase [Shumkonia mesophila]
MSAPSSHHIVFLDRKTIAPEIVVRRPGFEHNWREYEQTTSEQVVERAREATILIDNKVPLSAETLARLPRLKMIAVAATGTDCIDKAYCAGHGVVISNIRNYATSTVPEHTFALILALKRSLIGYRQDVIAGEWQRSGQFCFFSHPISGLAGNMLGIIGEGSIGQSVADIGKAFGMKPLFAAHKGVSGLGPLYTPFDEVIETADVITLHCPLLPQTANTIAMPEFRRMKRSAIVINTARGGLVNEADLATALREGLIAGAGFDVVTPPEPPADNNPLLALLDLPNFILTPHVAWASREAQQALADQLIGNIEAFVAGRPRNVVSGAF